MKEVEDLVDVMVKASGYSKEDIFSKKRERPLPALRWFIGDELVKRGFSANVAARLVGIDHATLLHGRKQIQIMERDKRWYFEYKILQEFQALCK